MSGVLLPYKEMECPGARSFSVCAYVCTRVSCVLVDPITLYVVSVHVCTYIIYNVHMCMYTLYVYIYAGIHT